eukprot:3391450-Amphidinium_carterae.1
MLPLRLRFQTWYDNSRPCLDLVRAILLQFCSEFPSSAMPCSHATSSAQANQQQTHLPPKSGVIAPASGTFRGPPPFQFGGPHNQGNLDSRAAFMAHHHMGLGVNTTGVRFR